MNARALPATPLTPPAGVSWGDEADALHRHYGCDRFEREEMRRLALDDPDGWKRSAVALYAEITQGRAGRSAAA